MLVLNGMKQLCLAIAVALAIGACAATGDSVEPTATPISAEPPVPGATRAATVQESSPVVELSPLAPAPGTTASDLANWTALVRHAFLVPYEEADRGTGPGARTVPFLQERNELMTIDILDSTPAYINALIGEDMSDSDTIANTSKLVQYWQQRVRYKVHFFFNGNSSENTESDIMKRTKVIENWGIWWGQQAWVPDGLMKLRGEIAERRHKYPERFWH